MEQDSMNHYPRDMIGYGPKPPKADWPGNARIALQFVLNYEEGGESNVLHGDPGSEQFLSEIIGAPAYPARHLSMESIYEYGSRAGVWRLLREFETRNLPLTVFAVAMALQRNPALADELLRLDHEIACHGLRWIHYQQVDEAVEREHMQQALDILLQLTGKRPQGWYTGRDSPNTRRLVVEQGGLVVPYTLDVNDMRFATAQGFNSGEQFFQYLKDSFDVLYAEGEHTPKMMSVGLHCRLVGRPGRFRALQRFLDYVQQHELVWICRRIDIAQHWIARHPPATA
jgi:peptidoglycan/xylan/chitin deacetylase (PgdA/CDA1 family)